MSIDDTNIQACILQVEDEDADIFLVRFVFQKVGITNPVIAVTDGQMAIDYLAGTGPYAERERYPMPCLVLLDLKMPKVSGMEVLAWIRQQPHLKGLVVVIFSSSAQPGDLERAYELGANSFVQKQSSLERSLEVGRLFKGWWLGFNRFAPVCEAPRPTGKKE